jgi:hypothetical protein
MFLNMNRVTSSFNNLFNIQNKQNVFPKSKLGVTAILGDLLRSVLDNIGQKYFFKKGEHAS